MHSDPKSDEPTAEGSRMLRLLFEVPTDGLHDLVQLLAPLKHIAYRSDLWLTQRDEASTRSSDNGIGEGAPLKSVDEEKR